MLLFQDVTKPPMDSEMSGFSAIAFFILVVLALLVVLADSYVEEEGEGEGEGEEGGAPEQGRSRLGSRLLLSHDTHQTVMTLNNYSYDTNQTVMTLINHSRAGCY